MEIDNFIERIALEHQDKPEQKEQLTLHDLYKLFSDKLYLGLDAFFNFLEFSTEHSDEIDKYYAAKLAEIEAMSQEEQEQYDIKAFWDDLAEFMLKLKEQESGKPKKEPKKEGVHEFSVSESKQKNLLIPIDKINTEIWKRFEYSKQYPLKAEKDSDTAKGKSADILVTLDLVDMSDVTLSRELSFYDERVFSAIGTLAHSGNQYMTANQIYKQMGNTAQPNAEDREKILSSVKYMLKTLVTVDNSQEKELYPKYDLIKGTFQLLNAEIVEAYANGTLTENVVYVEKMPKLFEMALRKKQIATVPMIALETPISQTPANLELEKYLIKRISQAKNKLEKGKEAQIREKVLLSTLFDNCEIEKGKPRARTIPKIEKLLTHWKKSGWIYSFTFGEKSASEKKKTPDSFTVILKK